MTPDQQKFLSDTTAIAKSLNTEEAWQNVRHFKVPSSVKNEICVNLTNQIKLCLNQIEKMKNLKIQD